MDEGIFGFKQFTVAHDKCAMKVNTDGVLLGAWKDVNEAEKILDIGTGCGVIALMMAQKNDHAKIDAIDIDESAFEQAKENFSKSLWSHRLSAIHCAIQDFFPSKKYDLIISNPPYFVGDYKSANDSKNVARHSVALDYEALIVAIASLLTAKGKALVAIPVFNFLIFESLANAQSLFVVELAEVTAHEGKASYLTLIQLERARNTPVKSSIQIQNRKGEFTAQYKALTADFYLKF
jgi:tRNA1Val (adenine37-N6)-methyltransferase